MFSQIIEEDHLAQVRCHARAVPDVMRALSRLGLSGRRSTPRQMNYADAPGLHLGPHQEGAPGDRCSMRAIAGFEFEAIFERCSFSFTVDDMFAYGFAVWTHLLRTDEH